MQVSREKAAGMHAGEAAEAGIEKWMYLVEKGEESWTVTIRSTVQRRRAPRSCGMGVTSKPFTAYSMKVTDGTMKWFLEKRYSDFYSLSQRLQIAGSPEAVPILPPKWESLLYFKNEDVVARRVPQLQDYVRGLCQVCNQKNGRGQVSAEQRRLTIEFLTQNATERGSMLLDTPPLSPSSLATFDNSVEDDFKL